jgi:predicted DNA-binding ribbon-helix-helix protein
MQGTNTKRPGAPSRATVNHNLLDARTWQALADIAKREDTTASDLLERIAATARSSRLLSAARIFVVEYYRSLLTETMARRH